MLNVFLLDIWKITHILVPYTTSTSRSIWMEYLEKPILHFYRSGLTAEVRPRFPPSERRARRDIAAGKQIVAETPLSFPAVDYLFSARHVTENHPVYCPFPTARSAS